MRRFVTLFSIFCLSVLILHAGEKAASGRVIKVLPHLVDLAGKHSVSPSLYDRDAYQAHLRQHPEQVSGIRYDIQWKAKNTDGEKLKLRIELRSDVKDKPPGEMTLEKEVEDGWRSKWTSLPLTGDAYKKFGTVTAWRATLWKGDQLLGEQKSFLW